MCSVQARRFRSGPMTARTLGFCSHWSRFFWLAFESWSSEAFTSSSLPSKSHAMRTLPLPWPTLRTTAPYHEPSYLAKTLVPTSCTAAAPTLTAPLALPRGLTVVPIGSQNARHPDSSSIRLSVERSVPDTAETAAAGTRTMEVHSLSSSGISEASPKGPPCGTSFVSMAFARRRSSPSPAISACRPRTSTMASDAEAIFDRWRAHAPPSEAGRGTIAISKPKSEPNGFGGNRSAKCPLILWSTADMARSLAAVRGRSSPNNTRQPCTGAGLGSCGAEPRLDGRTSTAGSSASPPPSHSTETVPSVENASTVA
mmetsp:Transcript_43933/g.122210  ORF Transcript_43933/g.122210 Transcript_43933/m.122210 type:complete len:313 (+) Transcript_43933:1140-2078(+)